MMIDGWGVAVDRVISDFVQGTVEWMLEEAENRGDWIIVEGQGSLDHPAYSSVTLGLIHGATPQAMVMVHKPGLAGPRLGSRARPAFPIAKLPEFIRLHEQVAGLVAPSKVVGGRAEHDRSTRTKGRRAGSVAAIAAETGLPTADPVRFGGDGCGRGPRRGGCPALGRGAADGAGRAPRAPRDPRPRARGPAPRPSRPVPHRPLRPRRRPRRHYARGRAAGRAVPGARRPRRGLPGPVLWRTPSRRWSRSSRRCSRPSRGFEPTADGVRAASATLQGAIRWNGGAKCAIDTAMHDLAGKVAGQPVHALLGLSTDIPPTDFTLGLDEPAVVAERARRAGGFPALKIKCGGPADIATLEAVRAVYDKPLRVDANTAWTPEIARQLLPALLDLGVELIEQPFPATRLDWLRDFQAESALPIVADESCVTIEDLDALVGVTAGVNVKLAKCGGPGPAARMLARARDLGFRTFLGCMEETSIAIAASAAVASLADWVDLDGNLLLADEPYGGLVLGDDYRWQLGDAPGLGVARRA